VSYSLSPNYEYPQNRQRTLKGYTANNLVEVTTDDLGNVGKIIDAATEGGANEVQSLEFRLKDQAQARAQALRKASLQAREEVSAMASALGLKLGKVLYLDAGGSVSPIGPRTIFAQASTAVQPPQTIEVQASVTLTVGLEQ
jgi:uncharacterized protein YggE